MDALYGLLKVLHIVSAMVWIGGLVALGVLNARLARAGDGDTIAALGAQSRFFGRAVTGPAMALTLLAGLGMVWRGGISLGSLWIVWGLVGLVASGVLGDGPIRQTGQAVAELAASTPAADSRLGALQRRLIVLNVINLLVLLSVVWAMVFKPSL